MRQISQVIVHCSASGPKTTLEDIRKWHKQKGWKDVGYHYVIEYDGQIRNGRSIEKEGAHCSGQNADSIGICLVGGEYPNGFTKFTQEQLDSLILLIDGIFTKYGRIFVFPHNHYNKLKSCPCFNVRDSLNKKKIVY